MLGRSGGPRMLRTAVGGAELLTEASQVSAELGRAFDVWRGGAGVAGVPCWTISRLLDFPSVLVSWAMVFVLEPAEDDFRVRYCGSSWTPFFGRDLTGRFVAAGGPGLGAQVRRDCTLVCDAGRAFVLHTDFGDAAGDGCRYYRIALPFRRAGSAAADVVVALSDPSLITHEICRAWDVPPPLSLERRALLGRPETEA